MSRSSRLTNSLGRNRTCARASPTPMEMSPGHSRCSQSDGPAAFWLVERVRQVVAGVRYDLRGGPAQVRGIALGLRQTVFGPDAKAGGRLYRRAFAGHCDRAAQFGHQSEVDHCYNDRDLRLPEIALRPR